MNSLPETVVKQDQQLAERLTRNTEELCRLRWHWTLDPKNRERVSGAEYARQVGVTAPVIRQDATAWHNYQNARCNVTSEPGKPCTLSDFRLQQHMNEERQLATEALARELDKSYSNVAVHHRDEVLAVAELAHDQAEHKGTMFQHEVQKVAQTRVAHRKAIAKVKDQQRRHVQKHYLKVQLCLGYAISRVREACNTVAESDPFDEEQTDFLSHSLASLRGFVNLLDRRITGVSGTDWDRELRDLVKEYAKESEE